MSDLYKRIESLCKSRGLNVTQMCKAADIPRANLSELKAGRKKSLGMVMLTKIASYFDVSVDYLLGNEKPSAGEAEGEDFELIEILEAARRLRNPHQKLKLIKVGSIKLALTWTLANTCLYPIRWHILK